LRAAAAVAPAAVDATRTVASAKANTAGRRRRRCGTYSVIAVDLSLWCSAGQVPVFSRPQERPRVLGTLPSGGNPPVCSGVGCGAAKRVRAIGVGAAGVGGVDVQLLTGRVEYGETLVQQPEFADTWVVEVLVLAGAGADVVPRAQRRERRAAGCEFVHDLGDARVVREGRGGRPEVADHSSGGSSRSA
jgi:hypothetical protein